KVEAKFTVFERKIRVINLSIKAKDEAEEQEVMATLNKQDEAAFCNAMADAFKAAKGE
nr:30S ribosomal protein S1 [Vibrio cholerae]